MAGCTCDNHKPQDVLLLEQDNWENAVFWDVTPCNVVETFISEQLAASAYTSSVRKIPEYIA